MTDPDARRFYEIEAADNGWSVRELKRQLDSSPEITDTKEGHIWLNLELAKKPTLCFGYILVHEMVHMIEPSHNERFQELMDEFMPQWRIYRDELNRTLLAYAEWRY